MILSYLNQGISSASSDCSKRPGAQRLGSRENRL